MAAWRILVKNGVLQQVDPGPPALFLKTQPVGAYTTTRTEDGASVVLLWERHMARLAQSVSLLALEVGNLYPGLSDSRSNWRSRLRDATQFSMQVGLARALEVREGGEVAVTVLACGAEESCFERQLLVHLSPYVPRLPAPPPARLAVMGPARQIPLAKFSAWARDREVLEHAKPEGVTEVVLSNDGDALLEGTITNFFVVKAQTGMKEDMKEVDWRSCFLVQTAPLEAGVLPGVIRQIVLQICQDEGIEVHEVAPSWTDRHTWKEAFITSSLRLVQAVQSIERPHVWSWSHSLDCWKKANWEVYNIPADGPVTRRLLELVQTYSRREGLSVAHLL